MDALPVWLRAIAPDVRFALRSWRKGPGVIALAGFMLAIAIGSTTAIFSVVKAILLNQLPYRDPDRVVSLGMTSSAAPQPAPPSFVTLSDWRMQSLLIESISVYGDSQNVIFENGEARVLRGMRVSWDFFDTLGAQVQFGRTFVPDEELLGHDHEIILTHALWLDLFGGDANAIGRTLDSASLGVRVRVIGILPESFHPPHMSNPIEWPQYFMPLGRDPTNDRCRSCGGYPAIARIKPDATVAQARAELNAITAKLIREYPIDYSSDATVTLTPLRDAFVGHVKTILWIVLAAVVFVLLIAAANMANLLLARATAREREIAIRSALGSGRGRIVRQLLTESLLLSLLAGVAGVTLAYWGVSVLRLIAPREIPRVDEIRVDSSILLFGLVLSLATGVLFGLVPAVRASRADLIDAIKHSIQTGWKRDRSRLRDLLVVSQIALAFVLATGTAVLSRSLFLLINTNPGFDFHNVLTLSMVVYGNRDQDWDAAMNYYRQVTDKVEAIPGVDGVAMVQEFPLSRPRPSQIHVQERPPANEIDSPVVNSYLVSPDYFRVLRIPVKRGRTFTEQDTLHTSAVAVISDSCARSLFRRENPIGMHIRLGSGSNTTRWATIIGVVGDVRNEALDRDGDMGVYLPQAQVGSYYRMLVRTRGNPAAMVPAIHRAFRDVDKTQPIWHILPMEAYISSSYADRTFTLALIGAFGTISLILAAVGIYGVISYTVSLRTREFGIRMALGAERHAIVRMVLKEVLGLLLCGIVAGAFIALFLTRFLAHLLYEVRPTDLASSALVVVILTSMSLVSGYLPSRRAASIDPADALRYD